MGGGRVVRVVTRLNRGGPLRQLEALVPGLRQHGWDGPVVVGRVEPHEPDGASELETLGVEVIRLPTLKRAVAPVDDARSLSRLARLLQDLQPDVVHTHLAKAGAVGRLAAQAVGVPAVHTFHGHHLRAAPPLAWFARRSERWLARSTAAAVVLTPRQRRDLVDLYRVVPAAKATLVPPGIDLGAVRARAEATDALALRRRLAPDGACLFVWAGRFVHAKDPALLVEAARRLSSSARIVLLGDGPLRDAVRARATAGGLADRVRFPGPVPDAAPWIAASDAVVLSSRSEGAPILLLEAKALARPAIATSVGGVPDVVAHGVDGLWVPPGDPAALANAIDRLARDPALCRRLGEAAGAGVEARYGALRLARRTAALYERVRARAAGGRAAGRR